MYSYGSMQLHHLASEESSYHSNDIAYSASRFVSFEFLKQDSAKVWSCWKEGLPVMCGVLHVVLGNSSVEPSRWKRDHDYIGKPHAKEKITTFHNDQLPYFIQSLPFYYWGSRIVSTHLGVDRRTTGCTHQVIVSTLAHFGSLFNNETIFDVAGIILLHDVANVRYCDKLAYMRYCVFENRWSPRFIIKSNKVPSF